MPDAVLLLIDAQESFRHRPYWSDADLPGFVAAAQALLDRARAAGIPVAQVFHVEEQGAFSLASGHVTTMAPLRVQADAVSTSAGTARWLAAGWTFGWWRTASAA